MSSRTISAIFTLKEHGKNFSVVSRRDAGTNQQANELLTTKNRHPILQTNSRNVSSAILMDLEPVISTICKPWDLWLAASGVMTVHGNSIFGLVESG
jgi:hypothetical protein